MTEAENIAAYERIHECIQVEVNKNPIHSKTVSKAISTLVTSQYSLKTLLRVESHPIIRFLIERNPSARLWNRKDYKDIDNSSPIYIISRHQIHYLLMPWIAKHYPWVLGHPDCQEWPPSIYFVDKLCQ